MNAKYAIIVAVACIFMTLSSTAASAQRGMFSNWNTNVDKKSIDLSELKPGGPPKDGIPSIDDPKFVSINKADRWLSDNEPVIYVTMDGSAKAYPLQILIWHEIANDEINGEPIAVTFCPLCYSALVFHRKVDGKVLEFGVSGFLRNSDLVMYDRRTESLWQQFTGEAIVGDYTGTKLTQVPGQILSFSQFRASFPDGLVLSRNTGYRRNYGNNPYPGYDDISNKPYMIKDLPDAEIPPMEKVIGVKLGEATKTYPYSKTMKERVINDNIDGTQIVVFHIDGATSALDARNISNSREDGSTGVFKRKAGDKILTFEYRSGQIVDRETGSSWTITGKAVDGPLKGEQLQPVTYGDYFAFAWLVFTPDTSIYQ